MSDYVLAESFYRANIQTRLWYVMGQASDANDAKALAALAANEKIVFGDRAYVIKSKKTYIMGNDSSWYECALQ